METQSYNVHVAQAVQRNDGTSKENLHFDDQSEQVVSLSLPWYFLKEIENMFFCVSIELQKHS